MKDPQDDRSPARRIQDGIGDAITLIAQAADEGVSGLTKRTAAALRDNAAGSFFYKLGKQCRRLIDDGKLPRERAQAEEVHTASVELVDDLGEAVPDPRRLRMLRRAFLAVLQGSSEDPEGVTSLLFLRVARRLNAEEAVVLAAAVGSSKMERHPNESNAGVADRWREENLASTGIRYYEAMFDVCHRLADLSLVLRDGRRQLHWNPRDGILTEYGFAFCEFLKRGEELEKAADA